MSRNHTDHRPQHLIGYRQWSSSTNDWTVCVLIWSHELFTSLSNYYSCVQSKQPLFHSHFYTTVSSASLPWLQRMMFVYSCYGYSCDSWSHTYSRVNSVSRTSCGDACHRGNISTRTSIFTHSWSVSFFRPQNLFFKSPPLLHTSSKYAARSVLKWDNANPSK